MLGHILCYVITLSNDWKTDSNGTQERSNLRNKENRMQFSLLIYFSNSPVHVSNALTIHHQEVLYCMCTI